MIWAEAVVKERAREETGRDEDGLAVQEEAGMRSMVVIDFGMRRMRCQNPPSVERCLPVRVD
jgi:hypothetical protein